MINRRSFTLGSVAALLPAAALASPPDRKFTAHELCKQGINVIAGLDGAATLTSSRDTVLGPAGKYYARVGFPGYTFHSVRPAGRAPTPLDKPDKPC